MFGIQITSSENQTVHLFTEKENWGEKREKIYYKYINFGSAAIL